MATFLGQISCRDLMGVTELADMVRPNNVWFVYDESTEYILVWNGRPTGKELLEEFEQDFKESQEIEQEEGELYDEVDFLRCYYLIEKGGKEISMDTV